MSRAHDGGWIIPSQITLSHPDPKWQEIYNMTEEPCIFILMEGYYPNDIDRKWRVTSEGPWPESLTFWGVVLKQCGRESPVTRKFPSFSIVKGYRETDLCTYTTLRVFCITKWPSRVYWGPPEGTFPGPRSSLRFSRRVRRGTTFSHTPSGSFLKKGKGPPQHLSKPPGTKGPLVTDKEIHSTRLPDS